jgi:hypothetical protein
MDAEKRRQLLEIAKAYEDFDGLPGKTSSHVERLEQKK